MNVFKQRWVMAPGALVLTSAVVADIMGAQGIEPARPPPFCPRMTRPATPTKRGSRFRSSGAKWPPPIQWFGVRYAWPTLRSMDMSL